MRKKNNLKLVIDTNIWISFVISNKLNFLEDIIINKKCTILFSKELLDELEVTIQKPKLKKYFYNNFILEMLEAFEESIEFVDVVSDLNLCRDAKDNFLLNLAIDGNADYLLTGDYDLLEIISIKEIKIITISQFLKIYSS